MDIEQLRDYCLSLPEVTEGTPFEKFSRGRYTILVFYVKRHMFCYFNIDDFTQVTLKSEPERIVELKERYAAVNEPFNGNKRHWIGVTPNADMSDAELLTLVKRSYEIVKLS